MHRVSRIISLTFFSVFYGGVSKIFPFPLYTTFSVIVRYRLRLVVNYSLTVHCLLKKKAWKTWKAFKVRRGLQY